MALLERRKSFLKPGGYALTATLAAARKPAAAASATPTTTVTEPAVVTQHAAFTATAKPADAAAATEAPAMSEANTSTGEKDCCVAMRTWLQAHLCLPACTEEEIQSARTRAQADMTHQRGTR